MMNPDLFLHSKIFRGPWEYSSVLYFLTAVFQSDLLSLCLYQSLMNDDS